MSMLEVSLTVERSPLALARAGDLFARAGLVRLARAVFWFVRFRMTYNGEPVTHWHPYLNHVDKKCDDICVELPADATATFH